MWTKKNMWTLLRLQFKQSPLKQIFEINRELEYGLVLDGIEELL